MSTTRDRLACLIGINKLYNATKLAGPSSTAVVAPNDDTVYSTAFLDLRAAPEVLTVPAVMGRYVNFQLLDMYTNTFADVGVLTDGCRVGRYAIVGPGWHGTIPSGIRRVDSPTPDVWVLGRSQVSEPADLPKVTALQRKYSLAPLEGHGSGTTGGKSTLSCDSPTPASGGIAILDEISADMAADPPLAQDGPVVKAMAVAGIGPGLHPVESANTATTHHAILLLDHHLAEVFRSFQIRVGDQVYRNHGALGASEGRKIVILRQCVVHVRRRNIARCHLVRL